MAFISGEKVFTKIITWGRNNGFHFSPKGKNVHWTDNCARGVKALSVWLTILYFIILEIQKQIKNRDASATQNELRQMTFELRRVDQEIHEKNDQIEKLNRDLRKVNLQSFVRETNSTKVKR